MATTSSHSGAVIGLIPTENDLNRLVLTGPFATYGEPRHELHLTLWFLGEASAIDEVDHATLVSSIQTTIERRKLGTVTARAFGVAHWNPVSPDPAWVLNVGDAPGRTGESLASYRQMIDEARYEGNASFTFPEQHSPWQPHICIAYSTEDLRAELLERLGDVTFDRVRIAFGGEVTDVSLSHPATVAAGAGGVTVPWHKVQNHNECPDDKPWAVVKDSSDEVEGCHKSEAAADKQLAALYASESDSRGETPVTTSVRTDEVAFARKNDEDEDRPSEKGDCPPGHHKMPDGSCMSNEEMAAESAWEGIIVVEGTTTGDGREFAPGALTWAEHTLLRWQKEGAHGGQHDVTVTVGRIDSIERNGNVLVGRGVLDLQSIDGFELWRRMKGGFAGGISIDADDITDADVELVWPDEPSGEEVVEDDDFITFFFGTPEKMVFHAGRIRAATIVDIPAFVEAHISLTGGRTTEAITASVAIDPHLTEKPSDGPWEPIVHERRLPLKLTTTMAEQAYAWHDRRLAQGNFIMRNHARFMHHEVGELGEVGPANLTACAALLALVNGSTGDDLPVNERRAAYEHLAAHLRAGDQEPPPATFELHDAVTAASEVTEFRPPSAWFVNPELSVPTAITVTPQGRVYGHAAQWGQCHVGYADECVTVPYEDSHPYFATGEITCADGTSVGVGQITVGTGHAPIAYRASRAVEHYDNTGAAVADVAIGNDKHGIWVAGVVRPNVETSRVHELRASGQVSGDWRRIGGQLRLVGLLAVNVPGFPVPRPRARVASGMALALVAAGHTTVGRTPAQSEEDMNREAMRRVMNLLAERFNRGRETQGV